MSIVLISIVLGLTYIGLAHIYAEALLLTSRVFSGSIKLVVSLIVYLIYSPVIVFPLIYLLQSINHLLFSCILYLLIIVPGMVYLKIYKLKALRNAGYFRSVNEQ